jgi:hypothetical protein
MRLFGARETTIIITNLKPKLWNARGEKFNVAGKY